MSHWLYSGAVLLLLGGAPGSISGTSDGTSTASATILADGALVGSSAGLATASAPLTADAAISGSSAGVAVVQGRMNGAIFWVSTVGSDSNGGTSYGDAKLTIPAGVPLLTHKKDILNIVNDGDHLWTVSTTGTEFNAGTLGTSFADYGLLVRGTDSSGNPALTTIAATTSAGSIKTLFRVRDGSGFVIIRNLEFDSTAMPTDATAHRVSTFNDAGTPDPGPIRFEGCSWLGASLGTKPDGSRSAVTITAAPPIATDFVEMEGCYFQNCVGDVVSGGNPAGGLQKKFDRCLIYQDWTGAVLPNERFYSFTNIESSSGVLRTKNCTFYEVIGDNTFVGIIDYAPDNGTNVGTIDVYNNVVFADSTNTDPDIMFFEGTGSTTSVTKSGTLDYNVLIGGPNVASGDIHDTLGWYQSPWDANEDDTTDPDVQANDTIAYGKTEAEVFYAPALTYAWDAMSNGVTITIPKDLRVVTAYKTAGLGGALPGALPEAVYSAISGESTGLSTVTGALFGDGLLAGVSNGTSTVSGTLNIPVVTNEKRLFPLEPSNEKVLASQSSNEKVLVSQLSNEKVVAP